MNFRACLLNACIGLTGVAPLAAAGAPPLADDSRAFVLNPTISGGVTFGGEPLATYSIWDPWIGDYMDQDLNAGDALYIYGGLSMRWPNRGLSLHLQGGRLGATTTDYSGYNEYGSFERWPVELIGGYQMKRFRAGFGITRHFSPTFKDETGAGITTNFADATGSVVEAEYLFKRFSLNWRYVVIDYKSGSATLNGDHVGIGLTYRFGPSW